MPPWTADQVLTLAPDAASAKAGRSLAGMAKWIMLGRNARAIWGECKGSGQQPYQTQIDLHEPAFKCSCPSRKFPCKHSLGLFLLYAEQSVAIPETTAPDWVVEWLNKRDQRAERKPTTSAGDPAQKTAAKIKRAAERETKVEAGLAELERWLRDLLRQGLAHAQTQPLRYWENMAARMVDAQASGIARWLREMAVIPASGEDWPDRLLGRLSLLHLLLEGYKRLKYMPEPVQADIRTAIGWNYREEDLATEKGLCDCWLVLGQRVFEEERLRVQRTWLWSQTSGRAALLLDFAVQGQPFKMTLRPGAVGLAELIFYPSNYPLRALVKSWEDQAGPIFKVNALVDSEDLLHAYADALARQPWLETFPAPLAAVTPVKRNDEWRLRDPSGRLLPVSRRFKHAWRLAALSGGEPLTLFGEWDGRRLLPLSIWLEPNWIRF